MEVAAIIALLNFLVPIAIKKIEESQTMSEAEQVAAAASLLANNDLLYRAVMKYRPIPPPKRKPK